MRLRYALAVPTNGHCGQALRAAFGIWWLGRDWLAGAGAYALLTASISQTRPYQPPYSRCSPVAPALRFNRLHAGLCPACPLFITVPTLPPNPPNHPGGNSYGLQTRSYGNNTKVSALCACFGVGAACPLPEPLPRVFFIVVCAPRSLRAPPGARRCPFFIDESPLFLAK
jgi:hypothetical protein